MPICVSYLTNTLPKIGGGAALFLTMPILPKMENTRCHAGNFYADIITFANFCRFFANVVKNRKREIIFNN